MSWTAPWKDQYQHQHSERAGLPLEVSCSGGQWSAGMTSLLVEPQHKGGGAESPHQLYERNSDTALSHTVPLHQFCSRSSDPTVTEREGPTPQHAPLLAFPSRLTTAVRGCWGGKVWGSAEDNWILGLPMILDKALSYHCLVYFGGGWSVIIGKESFTFCYQFLGTTVRQEDFFFWGGVNAARMQGKEVAN